MSEERDQMTESQETLMKRMESMNIPWQTTFGVILLVSASEVDMSAEMIEYIERNPNVTEQEIMDTALELTDHLYKETE